MSNTTASGTTAMVSSTTTIASTSATISGDSGSSQALAYSGISLLTFVTALVSSLVVFGIQMLAFLLLKDRVARIFKPKTYLVPEKERTEPPPQSPWGWVFAIFRFRDREVIKKCGLDAFFFLRYLQTLLLIFIPLAAVVLPILLPINHHGGRGSMYALEVGNTNRSDSAHANVTGLDQLAWGNIRPTHTHRYWAHLILALVTIIWVCVVFFNELRVYIKIRQDYLTSAEHRLKASATTVLVSSIPKKWLTEDALRGLYDVFPGGIRNIWINRNFDRLLEKMSARDAVRVKLEKAQTELIRKAKKAQVKQMEKEEKKARNQAKMKSITKEERAQKLKNDNEEAERQAQDGGGVSAGDDHQGHTIHDILDEEEDREDRGDRGNEKPRKKGLFKLPIVGEGLAAIVGTTVQATNGLADTVQTTNGFVQPETRVRTGDDAYYDRYGHPRQQSREQKRESVESTQPSLEAPRLSGQLPGNSTRRHNYGFEIDGATDTNSTHWWQLWKAPSGGFASPIPTGYEGDEFPLTQSDGTRQADSEPVKKGLWQNIKDRVTDLLDDNTPILDYPQFYNESYKEDAAEPVWKRYLKEKDRPTHRLQYFTFLPDILPGIPGLNKKVDTIYWCRTELARLNLEIEMDQEHADQFPLMTSAFIQFNHQVAAHMASQSATHHVPKHMAPRTVEISPDDVIWENMSMKWWEAWVKQAIVIVIVTGMVILWAFPVAWTATLSQLSTLSSKYSWLHWLDKINKKVLQAVAGVLPAIVLAILLALVPVIMGFLAFMQGSKTGSDKQGAIQNYYFAFLFVQVFLVVSISGGITAALASAKDITSIPQTLATQLPKAANYFFSYMILQALSTSSGTLLQIGTLILWFVIPKLFDNTAREKWVRNTTLSNITWGTFFPVYTNFACIAIIYSVIAPLILVFAIITFSLLYVAHRYNMVYVVRFKLDTGGLLYPRAINQTFTGLYMMEICMVGLFFLVRNEKNEVVCTPQAIIMLVSIFATILYQYLLNDSFGPLFRHLPITFEDEAEIRDQVFERAQARRFGHDVDEEAVLAPSESIEMSPLNVTKTSGSKRTKFNPLVAAGKVAQEAGAWAKNSGRYVGETLTTEKEREVRRRRRHRDAEAQRKIADALYGELNDEIEDLDPEERNTLIKRAFTHSALRAQKPVVWIPRDDIGVSDDEVRRTREYAGNNIWISNVGASLDGKARVVYGRNPPDFSEIDIINL